MFPQFQCCSHMLGFWLPKRVWLNWYNICLPSRKHQFDSDYSYLLFDANCFKEQPYCIAVSPISIWLAVPSSSFYGLFCALAYIQTKGLSLGWQHEQPGLVAASGKSMRQLARVLAPTLPKRLVLSCTLHRCERMSILDTRSEQPIAAGCSSAAY